MKVRCIEETQGLSLEAGKLILYKGEEFDYRTEIRPHPDVEGNIVIAYQELEGANYVDKSVIDVGNFENWQKIKRAVDICLEKTI